MQMSHKLQLPSVTLIAIAGNKQAETIAAMYKCLAQVDFAKAVLITNIDISCSGIEVINIGGLKTWEAYNFFCVKRLKDYFNTDFCLVVQWDGFILDAKQWDERFLDYDYVAAKWLDIGKPYNIGNGGFSLRSKFLQHVLATDENIITTCPEDVSICKVYGQYLMDKYGIKFATEEIADKFSFELNEPMQSTLGFHGFHWNKFRETVVIKRNYALGDVLMVEPILHYYFKKGYQVSLETNPEFYGYFRYHYFPITPREHLNPKLPVTLIDLNKAYEVFPKQLHLDSYYDFAQIPKEERVYRNPMLSLSFNYKHPQFKLFKKYVVFHIDERSEPHRNIYGVDWYDIARMFIEKGFGCIQVGMGKHEDIEGALYMNTPTPDMLMWLVASSDLFVGVDSGVSHIASGFDIPSVIFSGSVDLRLIHPDLSNKLWIHNHDKEVCALPHCWHESITETGQDCYVNKANPPCAFFNTDEVLGKIEAFLIDKKLVHGNATHNEYIRT